MTKTREEEMSRTLEEIRSQVHEEFEERISRLYEEGTDVSKCFKRGSWLELDWYLERHGNVDKDKLFEWSGRLGSLIGTLKTREGGETRLVKGFTAIFNELNRACCSQELAKEIRNAVLKGAAGCPDKQPEPAKELELSM